MAKKSTRSSSKKKVVHKKTTRLPIKRSSTTAKKEAKKKKTTNSNNNNKPPTLSLSTLSSSKPKPPLFRIASPNLRFQILENAASSISSLESSLLPHHGGRPWTCEVKLTQSPLLLFCENDNDNSQQNIELACLTSLLEQIHSQEKLQKPEVEIERTWYSPNLETFKSRKRVLEHVQELKKRDEWIDKCLFGNGKGMPPKNKLLEAGLYRFWRDGLWVVGEHAYKGFDQFCLAKKKRCKKVPTANELKTAFRKLSKEEQSKYSDASSQQHDIQYGLTQSQIDLCFSASLNHFDSVLYTVKARALYSELAQGFDLLRERGRGRYDMELPPFDDQPEFRFLTSPKAKWMPIVNKILGEEAELIHKGCFLSLPGSEAQVYHQDGVHLCTMRQKPCHAINVFIPLCDLTSKNGPTEFCLGTHMLGFEHFNKGKCYMPLVKAGTPIMFDYRLGHRGMANCSDEPRPVVYLTYTVRGFKDEVNFSRKRYRKLGTLVDRPVSREERAKRRADREKEEE